MGDSLATIDMHRKERGAAVSLFLGGRENWVAIQHTVAWAEAYLHTKWHPDAYSHFATIDMGQKLGEAVSLWGGSWVPI